MGAKAMTRTRHLIYDRRQISVRGTTHLRLKVEAEARNMSVSQIVEHVINTALDAAEQAS